jgi:GNAT superfamily N-acetyltransferase
VRTPARSRPGAGTLAGVGRLPHAKGMIRLGASAGLAAASSVYRRASLPDAGDRDNLLAHPEYLILGPERLAEGCTHVAEQDGSVAGFATWAETAGAIELEDLFAGPGYRRRGIATALVSRIAEVGGRRARSAWRSPPIRTRWGSTAPSASPTAASRKRSSAQRPAWSWCSPDSDGAVRSWRRGTGSMMIRPLGGRSGHSPRERRCINIRSVGGLVRWPVTAAGRPTTRSPG